MTSAAPRLSRVSATIATAFALSAAPASAAGFMYFKDSPIVGESTGAKGGRIHVDSWAWGATGSRGAADKWFVADSFSFGVEREMKESGEKGGTEDINIGVGELQEATISKSMDQSAAAQPPTKPMTWDNTKQTAWTSRAGPRARGSLSIKVPAGTCKAGARYPAAEFGTDKRSYHLTNVVVTGCGAAGGGVPMETLSLNYDKIVW
jgi:hypothetical protein